MNNPPHPSIGSRGSAGCPPAFIDVDITNQEDFRTLLWAAIVNTAPGLMPMTNVTLASANETPRRGALYLFCKHENRRWGDNKTWHRSGERRGQGIFQYWLPNDNLERRWTWTMDWPVQGRPATITCVYYFRLGASHEWVKTWDLFPNLGIPADFIRRPSAALVMSAAPSSSATGPSTGPSSAPASVTPASVAIAPVVVPASVTVAPVVAPASVTVAPVVAPASVTIAPVVPASVAITPVASARARAALARVNASFMEDDDDDDDDQDVKMLHSRKRVIGSSDADEEPPSKRRALL